MQTSKGIEAAIEALQAGNLPLAEELCLQEQHRNPFDASIVDVLAMIHLQKGEGEAALSKINNALSMDNSQALFHNHLGIILKSLGRLEDARSAYQASLELDPEAPDTLINLALLCYDTGNLEECLRLGQLATKLDPQNASAFNNLATAYQELGRFEDAIDAYKTAVELKPTHIGAHCNLANVLAESDRVDDALLICSQALEKWPGHPEILNAQSNAYVKVHKWKEALSSSEQSIRNAPDFAQAHYGKSLILLAQADFEKGLPEFEWRVHRTNFWPKRKYNKPCWDGQPLAGKTLLVHWEQGFGDIFQFARYLPLIMELSSPPAHIIFDCPNKLLPFFSNWPSINEIGDYGDTPPYFDYFVPLMSIPVQLGTTFETIPASTPYISNPLTEFFEVPKKIDNSLNVGIVWSSDHSTSYRRKVCPLSEIANLFDIEDVSFYGLQFGGESRDLEIYTSRSNVHNLANELGSFDHTAAIVKQMDLILSIDTYIVHLAGAMNIPVWIMLAFTPDWRWFLDCNSSPWYPSARLFRQKSAGDWSSVINLIRPELEQKILNRK